MTQTIEDLSARLRTATRVGARDNLVRRGLARGMIWREGQVPAEAYPFAESLTADLLDHGYAVLAQSLRLRDMGGEADEVRRGLLVAAESIESAVRRGQRNDDRDFHVVVASCAYHLAQYGARAYCLVPAPDSHPNLSTPELALVLLMRRSLSELRQACARWLRDDNHQDAAFAERLQNGDADVLFQIEVTAISTQFIRSIAMLLTALTRGDAQLAQGAIAGLEKAADAAHEIRHVPLWWASTLARHIADDLWLNSTHVRIPPVIDSQAAGLWAESRRRYISVLQNRGTAEVDLWPSQWEAAARCVDTADDLVVALPTSAGKTRIAELCILRTLADRRRVVYVTPLRALSAQLERTLGATFRPLGHTVTALYGASGIASADVNGLKDGEIVVATPEKLDFALRVDPTVLDDVGLVVLDEGHMIGLGTREIRYEVLVQRLLRRADSGARRIVCLSAMFAPSDAVATTGGRPETIVPAAGAGRTTTVPDAQGATALAPRPRSSFDDFTEWLRSDAPGDPIASSWRPTRQRLGTLTWERSGGRLELKVDGETPFVTGFVPPEPARRPRRKEFPADDKEFVLATAKAFLQDDQRVLIYSPQRRSVEPLAEALLKAGRQGHFPSLLMPDVDLSRALRVGREWLGNGHPALRALQLGVGIHHGTLPRPFLSEIEELLHARRLRLCIASPTLAQGVDLSFSVLIFKSIYRSGDDTIDPEEFANVVGRAGRAHVDLDGVSVFPVFQKLASAPKGLAAYHRLVARSATRRLESGLVQLVEGLISLLAQGLGASHEEVREYVLNVDTAWDAEVLPELRGGEVGDDVVAPVLAELDAAIIASVESLDCGLEDVAQAIDTALSSSLWARRLATRTNESLKTLAIDVVHGRARWLWSRTTSGERHGCHAAGLGYETGRRLSEHSAELVANLLLAEQALEADNTAAIGSATVALAERLGKIDPFTFEHTFPEWDAALRAWVAGTPVTPDELGRAMAAAMGKNADEVVPFLQQDVVYRLVWAVEAARLHAMHSGVSGADQLTGSLASVLTFGTPTRSGVVLSQSGLSSREMIARVLGEHPATFTTTEGLREWVQQYGATFDAPDFWPDGASAEMWAGFRTRSLSASGSRWSDRSATATVEWNPGITIPERNVGVSLVPETDDGTIYVCDAALMPLGRITSALDLRGQAVLTASIGTNQAELVVCTFGP
jgi:hypothetical protein